MSLLARAGLADSQPRVAVVGGPLAAFFLALGGKEIAYAGVVVVPFVIACTCGARKRSAEGNAILCFTLRRSGPGSGRSLSLFSPSVARFWAAWAATTGRRACAASAMA